jgi:hypothetical protein
LGSKVKGMGLSRNWPCPECRQDGIQILAQL